MLKFTQKYSLALSVASTFIGHAAFAGDAGRVEDVAAKFLYVPNGFDSNDQTEVVIDGFMPNACYKILPPKVEFDVEQNTYKIAPQAFHFQNPDLVCGTYEVGYTVTAKLGIVKPGKYQVTTPGAEARQLIVKQSTSAAPDDYLYAPVDQAYVDVNLNKRQITAYITGRYTNSCMRWVEAKVMDQGDTIVIMPIIRMEDRADCHNVDMSYKGISIKLPWRGPGRYLVHTRSLSGMAVNSMFSVDGE